MKRCAHLILVILYFAVPGMPHAAVAESEEEQRSRFEHLFRLNDTNGDGHVSPEEFQARSAEVFKNIDTNGDGKVLPDEMKAYHQKQFQKLRTLYSLE